MIKKFFSILLFVLFSGSAYGDIDFYLISDFHGAYDSFKNLVQTMSYTRQQRLHSPAVLGLNGDTIFGMGPYTDYSVVPTKNVGMKSGQAFSLLGDDYSIISGLGNHDTSDFSSMFEIDSLFVDQVKSYNNMLQNSSKNSESSLIVANLEFGKSLPEGLDLSTHQVLMDSNGKTIRAVAMVLETFFGESNFHPGPIIKNVEPLLKTAIGEIKQAKLQKQDAVVFLIHERSSVVADFIRELNQWREDNPEYNKVKVPFVQSGHDHIPLVEKIGSTVLVNSGAMGEMTHVILDDSLEVTDSQFYDIPQQQSVSALASKLSSNEKAAIDVIQDEITQVNIGFLKPLGVIQHEIPEIRSHLQKGSTPLGQGVADALSLYGKAQYSVSTDSLPDVEGFVGLWNSGNYRREEFIPAGTITKGLLQSMNPSDVPRTVLMTGEQLQHIYRLFRKDRSENDHVKEYTPQISSHLLEGENYELLHSKKTLPDPKKKSDWKPLSKNKLYAVSANFFVFKGGFGYRSVKEIFENAKTLDPLPGNNFEIFNNQFLLNQILKVSEHYGQLAKSDCGTLINVIETENKP